MPPALDLSVMTALPPYEARIAALNEQVGIVLSRQNMKDASGASQIDPGTQVTSLHGVSVLQAAQNPLESNLWRAFEPAWRHARTR